MEAPAVANGIHRGVNGSDLHDFGLRRNELPAPTSREDTGLSDSYISDLIVKHLLRFGVLTGLEIAEKLRLPFLLIDDLLDDLLQSTKAEKRGGRGMGNASDRFSLTERGRGFALQLLESDTYTGPAPVPLTQYESYVREHGLGTIEITEELLRASWRNFVLDDSLFHQVGPAIRSGKSCFLYGPPGTGKSTIAKMIARFLDESGGQVGIPHAVLVGGSIIRVFDPVHHHPLRDENSEPSDSIFKNAGSGDRRWVMCRRPAVTVGGELTLDMLDLRYNATTRFYEAPLQMKANGGVFTIDDFGRQMVKPKDLLNRWIIPLEDRIDFLTLHTGKKFSIPFEQFVVFATNLDPSDLADDAFLRRIRYKVFIGAPSAEAYRSIFYQECEKKNIPIGDFDFESFVERFYLKTGRMLRACDPRDLTDLIADECRFNREPVAIDSNRVDRIAGRYFEELKKGLKPKQEEES
ncbi:MAG: AAA family ATPase [bacterium]|nr:AAA family ATPase [bacterium]